MLNNLLQMLKTTSKRAVKITAEATGNLIGIKIADKVMKVSRTSPQNSLEKLQMKQKIWNLTKKYQKKDINLQKKDSKLLMN